MPGESPADRMRRALREIRREGYKVAVVYAVVDAAAVALLVNLVAQLVPVPGVPGRVALPAAVGPLFEVLGAGQADPSVSGAALLGLVAGLCTGAVEVVLRTRRPLVEQFEAANPRVREALRTARDAVEDGTENPIAVSLYEDVLAGLRETSSLRLLDARRVGLALVLVLGLSLASIQMAVLDPSLFESGPDEDDGPNPPREYTGLQDPDEILGEATDVSAGDEDLEARVGTSGVGRGNGSDVARAYETSGFAPAGDVESQQAGFREGEQLEDAELIREYNLRIREATDE